MGQELYLATDSGLHLVQSLRGSHRRLDVDGAHVLPVLLQQRHQEIDRQVNILCQVIIGHVNVTDSNTEAQNFLHLELDGCLDFLNLGGHRLGVGQRSREFTSLVQSRAQQTGNLLDQSLAGKESIIFLGCRDK